LKERERQEAIEAKQQLQAQKQLRTARLGKQKFQAEEKSSLIATTIASSLRSAKPTMNLLEDRFKSLQQRNVIEPRERAKKHRRYALKVFQKRNITQPAI